MDSGSLVRQREEKGERKEGKEWSEERRKIIYEDSLYFFSLLIGLGACKTGCKRSSPVVACCRKKLNRISLNDKLL